MKLFKKLFSSKVSIAIVFFLIGFFTNLVLVNVNNNLVKSLPDDRIPVTPEDFDHQKMLSQTFNDDVNVQDFDLSPKRREDDHFVYYDIPIEKNGKENKMNVEIKDGHIHLKSDSTDSGFSSSMEQVFTIDGNLDDRKAEVINDKDKIIIKIPKKK